MNIWLIQEQEENYLDYLFISIYGKEDRLTNSTLYTIRKKNVNYLIVRSLTS